MMSGNLKISAIIATVLAEYAPCTRVYRVRLSVTDLCTTSSSSSSSERLRITHCVSGERAPSSADAAAATRRGAAARAGERARLGTPLAAVAACATAPLLGPATRRGERRAGTPATNDESDATMMRRAIWSMHSVREPTSERELGTVRRRRRST